MMDEICARGLALPNCATCPARMNWSADMPSQAVSAARLLTSGLTTLGQACECRCADA